MCDPVVAIAREHLVDALRRLDPGLRKVDLLQRNGLLDLVDLEAEAIRHGPGDPLDLIPRRLLVLVSPAPVLEPPGGRRHGTTSARRSSGTRRRRPRWRAPAPSRRACRPPCPSRRLIRGRACKRC